MSKKTWTITVLVILVGLTSVAIYSNYKANNIDKYESRKEEIKEIIERPEITINTKHQYKDGIHTYIGTFETPNACNNYNAEIKDGENSEKIIEITYSDSGEICAQVITERNFRVSFEGSEEESQNVIATINGELVNLNIFEVPENQNIDDFEIFIKG